MSGLNSGPLKMKAMTGKFLLIVAATLSGWLTCGPATAQSPPAPSSVRDANPTLDWSKLDQEALDYFRHYLQFDTSDPPGDTAAAVAYLKGILEQAGIACRTFSSEPGKTSLLAKIPGPAALKPFLMMSHADVVPAAAAQWSHQPFSAELSDGYVWARGAIDNKAHGIMALMTMLVFKRYQIPLRRGLEMMVNPEEEVGGEKGAQWMVANHWDAIDPAFAVNEGGSGRPNLLGMTGVAFQIAIAEKRVMWLRLTAHGHAGHGSVPRADNPNLILIEALARLLAEQPAVRLTSFVRGSMKTIAPRLDPPANSELLDLDQPAQLQLALKGPLSDDTIQATLRDTISPTMLNAGLKVNVIPSTAEAALDCRLLPGTAPEAFLDRMRKLLNDSRIVIDYIQRPDSPPPSPDSGEAWDAITKVVATDFPGALVVPTMTTGGTDSRFLRDKGVPAYGFIPIILDENEARRFHGVDERLSLENLDRGIRATYDLAHELCAAH
ncbi:MAG TPA: M20/M25/M40 family metallo-hydrolase [Candidatus Binataceae bacterium]